MKRLATSALLLLLLAALILAALSIRGALALFTDTASVPANTFTTAASFGGSTTATFGSSDDSHVREGFPDSNSGTWDFMEVNSQSGKNQRAFVRFDISTIPAGSTVRSATQTLCTGWVSPGRVYDLHRVTASWAELTVTWNNQPAVAAAATTTLTVPSTTGCVTLTVTSDVQAWVNGTASNFGWRLKDQVEGNTPGRGTGFRSKEYTTAADRPQLEVTYLPP